MGTVEAGTKLSTSRSLDWQALNWRGPGPQQVDFEDIVKLGFVHYLETLAQAGAADQAKLRSLRQENDSSLPGWIVANGCERFSQSICARGRRLDRLCWNTTNYRCNSCNAGCHD